MRVRTLLGLALLILPLAAEAQRAKVRVTIRTEADRATAKKFGTVDDDYGSFVILHLPEQALNGARAAGLEVEPVEENIGLGTIRFDPAHGNPAIHDRFQDNDDGDEPRYYIVQFRAPVRDAWLESLRHGGLETIQYVPDNAYLVRATPAQMKSAMRRPEVRWSGLHHPAYKLSDDLAWLLGRPIVKKQASRQRYRVAVFRAREVDGAVSAIVSRGGRVAHVDDVDGLYVRSLLVEIDTDRVAELAALRDVARVETAMPLTTFDERSNQISAGNYIGTTVPSAGYATFLTNRGYDGTGVTVGVVDNGVDTSESHLSGRVTDNAAIRHGAAAGTDGHGHHDAGIIAGQCTHTADGGGFFYGSGMAPQAHIINIPYLRTGYIGTDSDAQADIVATTAANGQTGTVSSNSWGTFDVSTAYGTFEAMYDALVHDASSTIAGQQPLAIVFSAGNSGPSASTIHSPMPAKNIFVVGASENYRSLLAGGTACGTVNADNIDEIACFSSRGPAQDSRIRPDIVAPGTWVASARAGLEILWGDIDAYHRYSSGTSQAAPHVAGATALLQQRWKALSSGALPAPALTKAILINSAVDPTADPAGFIPNNSEGWGRLSLWNAMDPAVSMIYNNEENVLGSAGQQYVINGYVASAAKPFRVTLVWSDAPGAAGANPALVNNLDLEVSFGGSPYKGNIFTSGVSTTGGTADARNNVEAVYFPAGVASGAFTIIVRAANLAGDGAPGNGDTTDQRFALVVYNGSACPAPVISAAPNGDNRIDVSWSAVAGATSYRILRATVSNGAYTEVGTATSSPFVDTNVGAYITYYYVVRAVFADCESANSNEASATATGVPEAPTNLSTAIVGPTNVLLTWTASQHAASYRIYRSATINSFSLIATVTDTSHVDTTVSANTAYLYKVVAVDAASNPSADSNKALGTTFVFTDPNLAVFSIVKAAHFSELRSAVNAVRALAGMSAATFTDPVLSSSIPIKRVHLTELRTAIDDARSILGLPAVGYMDPTITAFSTVIKEMHVSNLRGAAGAFMPPILQLLANPGFESGAVNWTATPGVIDNTATYDARSGSWKAWLNGYSVPHTDTLEQEVSIPGTATGATLTFWLLINTEESPSMPNDQLRVEILNPSGTLLQTLATYSNIDDTSGAYVQRSFDVVAYKGQTIRVRFYGTENEGLFTSFLIDDTALNVTQ